MHKHKSNKTTTEHPRLYLLGMYTRRWGVINQRSLLGDGQCDDGSSSATVRFAEWLWTRGAVAEESTDNFFAHKLWLMQFQRKSPEDPNLVIRIGRTVNTDWVTVVGDLCRKSYGVQSAECTDLTGYDDLNFKLSKCVVNGTKVEDAFTFKFVNRWEEKFYPELCEAQAELAHLVAKEGIRCPQNVKTLDGLLYFESHRDLPERPGPNNFGTFADPTRPTPVVLRTFVPGTPLGDWVSSSATATSLFIGRVDTFCN
uniref:Uncharacterized protein n=1 Tax=Globodera rostochiensis TaxID=31243 RepID=A0A914HPE7_GLORO